MPGRHVKLGELLLGFEGLALLRGLVDATDDQMRARLDEIRRIAAELDQEPYSLGLDVPELDPRAGYASWAETYDTANNPLLVAEQPVVEEITTALPPGRALDAACGTGRHSSHLAKAHDVIGVDASPEMLARARLRVPGARFVQGDFTSLPFQRGFFDLVTCALALTHVPDLAPAVSELSRVTRPGGRVVITDMHPLGVAVIGQAFFRTAQGGTAFVRNHFHLIGSYLDAFAASGLRVIRCIEPSYAAEHIGGLAGQFIPEAARQALVGMPFAIVWELERA